MVRKYNVNTAVPSVDITNTGIIIPTEEEVLQGRLTNIASALGNASKELSSPQGQIAVTDTAVLHDVYDKLLILFNQINPDFAQGRFQDGIGQFYFIERNKGRGTLVTARCYGSRGTVIPAGSRAKDKTGNIYQSTVTGTISDSGYVDIQFVNVEDGANPCGSGELDTIYTPISGWDRIENENAGVLGNNVEGTALFESRRRDSVAINSRGTDQAILGALLSVKGVIDAYVWSNREEKEVEHGSTKVVIRAHSVYICVAGGNADDIAEAIINKYSPQGYMIGNTEYTWKDTSYNQPYPEYKLNWQTALPINVYFRVSLLGKTTRLPEIDEKIKNTVVNVFTGNYDIAGTFSGNARERIGGRISSSRYYSPIIAINPVVLDLIKVEVSLTASSNFTNSVTMGVDNVPTVSLENIEIIYEDAD